MKIFMLLLLAFGWNASIVQSQPCQATSNMDFRELSSPAANELCFNSGTPGSPGYWIENASTTEFIIWLGDSDLCGSDTECQGVCDQAATCVSNSIESIETATAEELAECVFTNQNCDSTQWGDLEITGENLLCGEAGQNPFSGYTRVFIPSCGFDWHLGQESTPPFNGFNILSAILDQIDLTSATKIVVGGTRGGGIGAMNLLTHFESLAPAATLLTVVDSAWYPNLPRFATTNFNNPDLVYTLVADLKFTTNSWIGNAFLDPDCKTKWTAVPEFTDEDLVNCLFPYEIADNSAYLDQQKIFFSQSQYDLLMLHQYGLADETVSGQFEDDRGYASNVLQYAEQFGTTMRSSIELSSANGADNHYWFATSCGQHGTIVPTNFHIITRRSEAVQTAGILHYSRTPDFWNDVTIGGMNLKTALELWINSDGNNTAAGAGGTGFFRGGQRLDRCNSFQCDHNPNVTATNEGVCPQYVQPFTLSVKTTEENQTYIVGLALGIIAIGWGCFFLVYIRVVSFRRQYTKVWKKIRKDMKQATVEEIEEEIEQLVRSRQRVISLSVTDLSYYAPPRIRGGDEYQILNRVTIAAKAGEVHAVMGPAGCGKTTLLDMLAYTRETGRMRGNHYINGVPSHMGRAKFLREWLRNNVSYVRQKDFLFPNLTVLEHLTHAAFLMLPQRMKTSSKIRRIYLVAKILNIDQTLDIKCGDGGVKVIGGLSGGQRRRVSTATQMLKLPAALILDEPTSGLDSANALALVKVLHNLAEKANLNVLMTIHQPRTEIFKLFHRLTILNKGSITFSGSPQEATKFFNIKTVGANIGNDILDKLKRIEDNSRQLTHVQHIYLSGKLGAEVSKIVEDEKTDFNSVLARELKKVLYREAIKEGRISWTKPTGYRITTKILMSRTILRGGFDVGRTVLTALFGGLLVGLVFLENESYTGSTALAYLLIASMAFLQSTFLGDRYQLEKGMWSHEKDNGTVVSWVAFLTSLFLRNIVSSSCEGLAFALPSYWMGKLNADPERFFLFLILMVIVAITVIAQNTMVEIDRIRRGSGGTDVRDATIINMFFISVGALFNGFIIQLNDIPSYLQWVPYTMLTFWGFVGILVNNFRAFIYPCDISTLECASRTGDNFVREFEYDEFDVYQCIFALCGLLIVFHVLSIIDFWIRFVRKGSTLKREDAGTNENTRIEKGKMGRSMAMLVNEPRIQSAIHDSINDSFGAGEVSTELDLDLTKPKRPNRSPQLSPPPMGDKPPVKRGLRKKKFTVHQSMHNSIPDSDMV